jgi:hypothetical protein
LERFESAPWKHSPGLGPTGSVLEDLTEADYSDVWPIYSRLSHTQTLGNMAISVFFIPTAWSETNLLQSCLPSTSPSSLLFIIKTLWGKGH